MNDQVIASLVNALTANVKELQDRLGKLEDKISTLEKASAVYFNRGIKAPTDPATLFKVLKQDQEVNILKDQASFNHDQ